MTEGKAFITFGYDTTLMLGGQGIYNDDNVVGLHFRSREPGPVRESEIKEAQTDLDTDISKFDVTMVFKSIESIDSLINQLNAAREVLSDIKNKENEDGTCEEMR